MWEKIQHGKTNKFTFLKSYLQLPKPVSFWSSCCLALFFYVNPLSKLRPSSSSTWIPPPLPCHQDLPKAVSLMGSFQSTGPCGYRETFPKPANPKKGMACWHKLRLCSKLIWLYSLLPCACNEEKNKVPSPSLLHAFDWVEKLTWKLIRNHSHRALIFSVWQRLRGFRADGGNVLKTFINRMLKNRMGWRTGSGGTAHTYIHDPSASGIGKPGKSCLPAEQTMWPKWWKIVSKPGKVESDRRRQSILTSALYACMHGGTNLHMKS